VDDRADGEHEPHPAEKRDDGVKNPMKDGGHGDCLTLGCANPQQTTGGLGSGRAPWRDPGPRAAPEAHKSNRPPRPANTKVSTFRSCVSL
jgi:hypothetical protein